MKRIILICSVALFASCGIYKPYSRPEEVKTDNLYGADYEAVEETSLADLEWKEIFTDPQLQQLIERALEQNSDMQSAHWRIKEAEAALKSARLAFLPSFNFAPNGGVSSFDNSAGVWTYTVPLAASWQIDIFGGINNAKRRAKATYALSQEYRQAVRTQIIAGVGNLYYTLLMLDSQYLVTARTAESLQESAETMAAMMEAGMANRAAVTQIEAAAYATKAALYDLEYSIREVENSLCAVLGEVPHTIERSTLEEQSIPAHMSAGIPLQMLSLRPDVRIAELSLEQAFYTTAASRSALYPTLTLEGVLGWTNSAGSMVINPGKMILSAAGSLVAPIFNGGRARAQLKIAKAQQQEALIAFQQTLLNAGGEVNNALMKVQTLLSKRDLRAKQIEALEAAYESTQLLMDHGSTTYLEVLTAEQNLLSGRTAAITDKLEELQAMITLYTSLGGGREAEPQEK